MAPNDSQAKAAGPAVEKHRACDACRNRKLACTKEPDGCSRCRREGITCHYSPQKPMGRPRKRRIVEDQPQQDEEPAVVAVGRSTVEPAEPATSNIPSINGHGGDLSLPLFTDPNLDFDHNPSSSLDFLDLLPPSSYQDELPLDPHILIPNDGQLDSIGIPLNLNGVDLLESINFDEPDTAVADMSKDISDSLQRYWHAQQQQQHLEPAESQTLSSNQSQCTDSPEPQSEPQSEAQPTPPPLSSSSESCPKPMPSIACGCLSSLYLALDSLSRLPQDINTAMRVARNATKTAHNVMNCAFCSDPDISQPPPIQSFQSLMFLAALIPSACNAYASILQMIDRKAKEAKKENRTFWFSFEDIGGVWCGSAEFTFQCPEMQDYNNSNMEPDLWRTTMRAILRLDVYGLSEAPDGMHGLQVLGLRDIVKSMEARSHRRHAMMDEMAESGSLPKHEGFLLHHGEYKPLPVEERNCIKVLEAARIALDHLVIA
ncbi:unnamed protein product [Clonostachys byssicola]|uniref:Zn(2)-C6 fungal-type domain-containing protein n=1 Tax=Clonostachys byssicola TaxID=160290 RepID=A0A9N9U335_9HYPO|nr:unnamed protein product [Clonostachys byssicola]